MKAPPRLDFEKDELIPAGSNPFARDWFWFISAFLNRVELESTTPIALPDLVVWEGHVQDIGHATGADDIVVVQKVTSLGIRID